MAFLLFNVSVFGQTNLSYFDYLNLYYTNYDSTETEEGGMNRRMQREVSFYSPRLAGVNGDFSVANKVLTDYSRAYSHSSFNTSGVSNKNEDIPEASCFFGEQPEYLTKHWEELGPFGDNIAPKHGQIHNFAYSPNFSLDHTMYACSYYGGVWKSTNRGQDWTLLTQNRKLPFAGVGNVVVHPNNAETIFISTGKNCMKSPVITSFHESNDLFTSGIFRSTDGGTNWEEIMDANIWASFEFGGNIKNMLIDPNNSNVMYLATSEGIWRSNNILVPNPTWSKISTFSGADDDFKGIAIDYSNPNFLYFSGTKLVRINKTSLSYTVYNYPAYNATSTVVTSNIATTPDDPYKVYSYLIEKATINGIINKDVMQIDLFDFNTTTFINKYTNTTTAIGSNRIAIAVSPTNADWVLFGQLKMYQSLNFTNSNHLITPFGGGSNNVHADIHAISFAPQGYGVFLGTDGGISYRGDNGSWITQHQGINNTLIQDFDDSEVDNNVILIGLQDNQSFSKTSSTNWLHFGSVDGYNTYIDDEHYKNAYYTENFNMYGRNLETNTTNYTENSKMPGILYSTDPGIVPTAPMQNHPKTGKMIFTLRNGIYQKDKKVAVSSDTPTDVWSEIVSTATLGVNLTDRQSLYKSIIAESDPEYMYALRVQANPYGSNSASGPYFFRKKPNTAWESIGNNYSDAAGTPPVGWLTDHYPISAIAVSSINPEHIWVSISGYNNELKVFKSTDAGNTFTNADPTFCLPNLPVNDIVYQDGTNDRIYIATDAGVYTTEGADGSWYRYGDIPNVRVDKLKINRCSGTLKASTYGRGLFETDLMPDNGIISNGRTIVSNETWTEDKALTSNLSIAIGKTLTIDGATIYMPKNGRIIVQTGAQLNLKNGAKITNGCGEMWDGIIVMGSSINQQPTVPEIYAGTTYGQGVLKMNNATLEHAKEAIRLHANVYFPNYPLINSFNGGVVLANNSFFINNRRSAEFMKYTTDASTSEFKECEFITNEDYRLTEYTPFHITLWENHGTRILNCKFEDQRTSLSIYDEKRATGIQSIDANYVVSALCNGLVNQSDPNLSCSGPILPNEFIHLRRGIHASGTGAQPSNLQIVDNNFDNCIFGVTLEAMDGAAVVKNRFSQNENIFSSDALYLHASNDVTVTKNEFKGLRIALTANAMGWAANERIYKNSISKTSLLENGYNAVGIETQGYNNKLRIDCNNFNYMYYDLYSIPNGSQISLGDQGTTAKPVANTFNNSFTTGVHGYLKAHNELIGSYNYKAFDGVASMNVFSSSPNINTSVVSGLIYNSASGCPDLPLGDIIGKTGELGLNLQAYYSTLQGLDYTDDEDAIIIDETINILISHYQNTKEIDKIIALLLQYPDYWHQVQLASFYTLNGQYTNANNLIASLITGNATAEVKDLAELYSIKNNLEKEGKTWFEINATDKDKVKAFALREDDSPATIKSRNVLYLIDNMFFEEKLIFPEMEGTTESTILAPKPKFEQYPNPIVGMLYLKYAETINEPFKVYIYNLINNTQVYEGLMENSLFTLDVSSWITGFYSIVVKTAQGEEIYKSSTKIKN